MVTSGNDYVSLGLLVLRLGLGIVFFAHGAQKVLGWYGGYGLKGTVGWFKSLGIPEPVGYLGAYVEFLGAFAVVLGVLTRLAALALVVQMAVAMILLHLKVGFFMNWGSEANRGEGYEYNVALIAMALTLLITGPGAYALVPSW